MKKTLAMLFNNLVIKKLKTLIRCLDTVSDLEDIRGFHCKAIVVYVSYKIALTLLSDRITA